jgi:hypothetical protein
MNYCNYSCKIIHVNAVLMSKSVSVPVINCDQQTRHKLWKLFAMKDAGLVPRTYKIPLIKHKIIPKTQKAFTFSRLPGTLLKTRFNI